jgi:multicomponent Na+:H+ antiporter subunit D
VTGGTLIMLALGTPLVGALGIAATGDAPNQRETVTLVTAAALLAIVLSILNVVLNGGAVELTLAEPVPGLPIAFAVEPLGMIFALVASSLWIVNSVYSIGYMRGNDEEHQTRFYVCFALALASTVGLAFAGNLLTFFIFYEALTLSTYPLVTHHGDAEAKRAGRVYLGVLVGTSIGMLLFAILLTWSLTGDASFRPGGVLDGKVGAGLGSFLLLLFMFGIGKAALMPFHRWLPAAMVAPTPVSALLHAVAVVKAGVFGVVKVAVYVFGLDYLATLPASDFVFAVACVTLIGASLIALRQDNLKRRLAYSTVSQLSYVVMATFVLAPISVMAAAVHIAAHALGKITLFFAAGSIYTAAHKTEVSQLDGIGRRMPWTMAAFTIGALSMIGVPPAAGFISKWYMLMGAIDVKAWIAVAVIAASTLLNAAYYLPIVHAAFLKPAPTGGSNHGEAPLPIVLALTATAGLTVLFFLFPNPALELAGRLVAR